MELINQIINVDCLAGLKTLPDCSVNCCVTSPPYFNLRDYKIAGQIGLEQTPQEFVNKLVAVFREVRRVLRDDGTLWLVIGDSYAGSGKGASADGVVRLSEKSKKQITSAGTHEGVFKKTETPGLKPKDLIGIPWRVAFALQSDGWYLRQDIIWAKPNPMPESVRDRCTKSHEYIFMLSKSATYYYDHDAIKEKQDSPLDSKSHQTFGAAGGKAESVYGARISGEKWKPSGYRNKRDVWTVAVKPLKEKHFAAFPPELIRPCILAGCPAGGIVLDPFMGAATTALVAKQEGRNYIGFELNPEYCAIAERRIEHVKHQPRLF